MMSEFKENVLATLAYYDVFDWPLKAAEVLKCLVKFEHLGSLQFTVYSLQQNISLNEIQKELDQLILERIVGCREGYYFLFDREYLAPLRLKRKKIAKRKWQIARRAVWWLRLVPYVRVVFASGSLAMSNTDELSDLDVLIVVKHGRIWLSRFLILGVLALLGKRRRGTDRIAPDKICPNHFITDRSLTIPFKSIYNAQTYANLTSIYAQDTDIIEKFKKANNWVLDYVQKWNLEMFQGSMEMFQGSTSKHWVKMVEWVLDWLGIADALEKWLGQYQSRRITLNPATHQTGGRVIFTDEQLEFHPCSIETKIIEEYNEQLVKLNLPQLAIENNSGLTP